MARESHEASSLKMQTGINSQEKVPDGKSRKLYHPSHCTTSERISYEHTGFWNKDTEKEKERIIRTKDKPIHL